MPGPVAEVVGVGQHDLAAECLELLGEEALERPLRPHRHEHGSRHRRVRQPHHRGAGLQRGEA